MSAADAYPGLTYDEIRWWAADLEAFTASDLADALGTDLATARRAILALTIDGICWPSEDVIDGPVGYETIVDYIEPPPGPDEHPHRQPPERAAVADFGRIAVQRGMPVRIRTERKQRRSLSTPGQRQKHKNSEAAYQRMQDAIAKRMAEQKAKPTKEPKWKRKRK